MESELNYTPFKAITTEPVRMCESVSHITSPLVKLFTVSRQASTADGDQCGQGVLWWLVWECEPAPGARCVARRGGGREGVIPLTYSSLQFYNILHHPELFPCIRVLGDGVSNWWREHKQDTGHLYHSAPACVTPDQLLLSVVAVEKYSTLKIITHRIEDICTTHVLSPNQLL